MVTKETSLEFFPDDWTSKAEEIASKIIHSAQNPGQKTSGEATSEATKAICELVDRCVKEAVLMNLAIMTDAADAEDFVEETVKNMKSPEDLAVALEKTLGVKLSEPKN